MITEREEEINRNPVGAFLFSLLIREGVFRLRLGSLPIQPQEEAS